MKKITLAEGTVLEITDEAYQALLDANKQGRWRAEEDEDYFLISDSGDVDDDNEDGDGIDDFRFLTRNYFQTREEAEAHLNRLLAIARVSDAIDDRNGGWVPDWKDENCTKWEVVYYHKDKAFTCCGVTLSQSALAIPHIKSRGIAESIIRDFEGDLKVIFNV